MQRSASSSTLVVLGIVGLLVLVVIGGQLYLFATSEEWRAGEVRVGYEHHGSTIRVEPDEEFFVGLRANGLYPEVPWQVAEIDTAMLELTGQVHDTEVRSPGDYQGGEGSPKPWSFMPGSDFGFVARAEGESQLVFDIRAEGELVDVYEVTVAVVDEACDVEEAAAGTVTPIRCEDEHPEVGPAGLVYDEYGWAVRLEPGDEFTLELRADSTHPDIAWQVAEVDPAVVELLSVVHDTDVRASPEHARWPPTVFPETRLTFIGRALGESPLVLEMRVGDEPLDVYQLNVFVVADACAMGPDPWNIFTPRPCEMAPARY